MAVSPTQRTLEWLRKEGYRVGKVERWIERVKKRIDLFGFIDLIAIGKEKDIVGIQSCGQAFSEHKKKICIECREAAEGWLGAGGRIILIGWRRLKVKRGGKAMRWEPRILEITPSIIIEVNEENAPT